MESSSENIETQAAVTDPKTKKEKSLIDFAYTDLAAAEEVARGVHNAGGTSCDSDQLAAQLGLEAKGGGFRVRIAGAQTFGLVNYERGGRVSLTDLGMQLMDPEKERLARVNSFLHVELYQKVYEQFKGGPLPPAPAIDRAILAMGVPGSVKGKARQVLMRSAKTAGFFEHAQDRLIKPSIKEAASNTTPAGSGPRHDPPPRGSGGGGEGGGSDHPLIKGLLLTLPSPGETWAVGERLNWLRMADSIFKMIYKRETTEGDIAFKIVSGGE